MNLVPNTQPEMYQGLQRGDFVTEETHHVFNQIPDDQVLEHVNKNQQEGWQELHGRTNQDIVGVKHIMRAQLSEDTKAMFDIVDEKKGDHRNTWKATMR